MKNEMARVKFKILAPSISGQSLIISSCVGIEQRYVRTTFCKCLATEFKM